MRTFPLALVLLFALSLFVTPVLAEAEEAAAATDAQDQEVAEGTTLAGKVLEAYKNTKQYQASKSTTFDIDAGGMKQQMEIDLDVAFDRPSNQFIADAKDMQIIVTDGNFHLLPKPVGSKYVKSPVESPITAKKIGQKWEAFEFYAGLPDVSLLLAGDQELAFQGKGIRKIDSVDVDGVSHPRLLMKDASGSEMTYTLNPQTHLITAVSGSFEMQGADVALSITIDIKSHDKPLKDDTFAVKTGEAEAVGSLRELVEAPQEQDGPEQLIGKDAPAIELTYLDGKEYSLAKDEADIVVLDFWATWCPPCRRGLPMLQSFYDWAKENNKSIAVYAVNLREGNKQVKKYWDGEGYTIPVLMDKTGSIGTAYMVRGIPQTVMIHNGKVADVHVGLRMDMEDILRNKAESLLGAPSTN